MAAPIASEEIFEVQSLNLLFLLYPCSAGRQYFGCKASRQGTSNIFEGYYF